MTFIKSAFSVVTIDLGQITPRGYRQRLGTRDGQKLIYPSILK